MKVHKFLQRAARLPMRGLDAFGPGGLVVVAPHPDDESLGCGGVIAACVAEGRPVSVVVLSDGSGSHPASRTHPRARLARLRETETLAAMAHLGLPPRAVHFLRLTDQQVPTIGPEASRAARAIADIAALTRASAVAATWSHDPHCDHLAASTIAEMAMRMLPGARLLAYPVWGWTLPKDLDVDRGPLRGFRIDVSPYMQAKSAAIEAHASQHGKVVRDDPDAFQLEAALLSFFERPFEVFLEVDL